MKIVFLKIFERALSKVFVNNVQNFNQVGMLDDILMINTFLQKKKWWYLMYEGTDLFGGPANYYKNNSNTLYENR